MYIHIYRIEPRDNVRGTNYIMYTNMCVAVAYPGGTRVFEHPPRHPLHKLFITVSQRTTRYMTLLN